MSNIQENILNKLIYYSDVKQIKSLIAHSNDWSDIIFPALHELKRLIASDLFDKDENKQYLNKILTAMFVSIYVMGYNNGKVSDEINELERMFKL